MKTFKILFALLLLVATTSVFAQEKSKPADVHKVVMQFNDADSVSQVRALMQVENIIAIWPDAKVEVVCLSMGLDMLTTKSKVKERIALWGSKGVTFAACNNTMTVRGIKKEELLQQAVIVPAAVIELATKQNEGWAYFRAGK